jgi:hypothetical protein
MAIVKKLWNQDNKVPRRNFIIPLVFFISIIIYLELILHLLLYRSVDLKIIYPILFSIPAGALRIWHRS